MGRAIVAIILAAAGIASAAEQPLSDWRTKASPEVQRAAAGGPPVVVLIRMRVPEIPPGPPGESFEARVTRVVAALRVAATRDQAGLRQALARRGIASRPLWIAGVVVARTRAADLAWVGARADVVGLDSDAPRRNELPPVVRASTKATAAIEANVTRVRAPEAWALGHRGAGVTIGAQDTGYLWNHPALIARYRGWNGMSADHDHAWHDSIHALLGPGSNACGVDSPQPCDDNGHGTHTLGTMLGDDGAGNQVGVAPDATWIACRNMDRGVGRPSTYLECMQWFMAPTDLAGQDPRPDLAPHVISNSWSCPLGPPPNGEDCALASFDAALANLRAAGILFVAAATNSGPNCSTVIDPPAISAVVFTIGLTDNNDTIVNFSSRGPVLSDGSGRHKPDLMAPGLNVRSSVPVSSYGLSSGTSMATPNVAAVAALMMSANPTLRGHPEQIEAILRATAVPLATTQSCGGIAGTEVPNNTAGHGRVDAFAAVLRALDSVLADGFE